MSRHIVRRLNLRAAAAICWCVLILCCFAIWLLDCVYSLLGWLAQDERDEGEHWEARK